MATAAWYLELFRATGTLSRIARLDLSRVSIPKWPWSETVDKK